MTDLEKRAVGRTTLKVTALGLGCATLGGSRAPVSRKEAEAIVRAAWAAGVRYVDTAPFYGLDRQSAVSATRCAKYRVTNGCCRQKSGGCCAHRWK
jgi:aryl-alcohol dehydrogenase-like predicted oxidoreductase